MNNFNFNYNHNPDLDLDLRFPSSLPPSPQPPSTTQQTQDVVVSASALASSSSSTYLEANVPHRMKKKRSKQTRPDVGGSSSSSSRPKPAKKPDPTAPKITTPCSECGRKFWSWKALFGHMRCHPERHWRGIQPPPQRHVVQPPSSPMMTQDDHDAASSLLILADQGGVGPTGGGGENDSRFECSSCKKVFGSHQALGGHRASHKNVKGCFAINNPTADQQQDNPPPPPHAYEEGADMAAELEEAGHQCGICQRVFSSGQALGGHKRCHWERGEDSSSTHLPSYGVVGGGGLDLNLPASAVTTTTSVEEDHHQSTSSYSCSGLALDLRLGL